jgi:uncharacterized protein (DUF433 family)
MTLRDIESQLLSLSLAEKAEAVQLLLKSISHTWAGIEKTPGVCSGDACIAKTRIPVWVLVQARSLGSSEAEILQDYPTLTATDLANAWAYALANAEEIETAIQANEAA